MGIDILKGWAALLIINSHLEHLYPRSFLAADGMLGHTIFFFTNGYTLAGSIERRPDEKLHMFLWKRFIRLYPALWIITLLLPSHQPDLSSVKGWADALIYPTQYTFVQTIVPLYPIFYMLHHVSGMRARGGFFGILLLVAGFALALRTEMRAESPGVAWSAFEHGSWNLHLFGAMLVGGWKAGVNSDAPSSRSGRPLVLLVSLSIIYIALRLLALSEVSILVGPLADGFALLSMPICVGLCLCFLRSFDLLGVAVLSRAALPCAVFAFLAKYSWETYLIHDGVSRSSFIGLLAFPWNVAAVFAITLWAAPFLHWVTDLARFRLFGRTV